MIFYDFYDFYKFFINIIKIIKNYKKVSPKLLIKFNPIYTFFFIDKKNKNNIKNLFNNYL